MAKMGYQEAADIRKEGALHQVSKNLVQGKGIGQSFKEGISSFAKAKATGIKEKFDPLNLVKKITGGSSLGPALLGRLTGRSQKDIEYFTGIKKERIKGTSADENLKDLLDKLYLLFLKTETQDIKIREINRNFAKQEEKLADKHHEEIVGVLTSLASKKESEEKQTIEKEKQDERKETAEKIEPKKGAETPKAPTPPKVTPKKPAAAAPKKPAAGTAKPTPVKPQPPTGGFPTGVPPAATAPAASTAARVGGGAAAAVVGVTVSSAALANIQQKEGFSAKAYKDTKRGAKETQYSIGYGHQITNQEIKQGYIPVGNKKIPVVGDRGKDTIISKEDAITLSKQDYVKYENYAKTLPNFEKLNEKAQVALIDMSYNMGVGWADKWPIFRQQLTNMDLDGASRNILGTIYAKQTGKRAVENAAAIKNGAKPKPAGQPLTFDQVQAANPEPTPIKTGEVIGRVSRDNSEILKDISGQPLIIINNNNNMIVKPGDKSTTMFNKKNSSESALMQQQRG